jgi:transitional endoplasmic reticulum ATPase
MVKVRPITPEPAREITLAPTESSIHFKGDQRQVRASLLNRPLNTGDIVSIRGANERVSSPTDNPFSELKNIFPFFGDTEKKAVFGEIRFLVVNTNPQGIVIVNDRTEIEVKEEAVKLSGTGGVVTYDDVGGLSQEIIRVREMIELPLKHPELFERLHIDPPKGVLLYGPPGTGKTLLAKAVANESDAHFVVINGPEIMSKFYGASEERLRNIFDEAAAKAPSIIFIDEIDSIAPKREEVTGEVERRVVAQLLSLLDGLKERGRVIVIGATNRPNAVDPALRRPGRLDREIELKVPDLEGRIEIMQIHTRGMPLGDDVKIEEYAQQSHGFVGADLMALCREAAMFALRRLLPKIKLGEPIPEEIIMSLQIEDQDFQQALKIVEPSAMREVLIEIPNVHWDDVGGLESVKQELQEAIEWPLKYPHLYKRAGIRPLNGVLIYGPPGCGKTMLAKACATETQCNFISVKGPEVFNKFVGESERAIREIFRKARMAAPAIVYFDELDAIASQRTNEEFGSPVYDSIANQLLAELDGIEDRKGVVVVGSTNRPQVLDPALLRPGRFDRLVFVSAPDVDARLKILQIHTKGMALSDEVRERLPELAAATEGYSGADLENVCREAGMAALRETLEAFEQTEYRHFEEALRKIPATLTKEVIDHYNQFAEQMSRRKVEFGPKDLFT